MDLHSRVPAGCLWIYDERSSCIDFIMGVDFGKGDDRCVCALGWIDKNGKKVFEVIGEPPAENTLIVVNERYEEVYE